MLAVAVMLAVIVRYGRADRARPADVIIVLGGGVEGTERRTRHAAALYGQGIAPAMLCTGGIELAGGQTEAAHCAAVARREGVPAAAIWLEDTSHNTAENARNSRAILAAEGWRSAVLVSDSYHLWRADWLFGREGVTIWTSPAQRTTGALPLLEHVISLLREVGAVGYYAGRALLGVD